MQQQQAFNATAEVANRYQDKLKEINFRMEKISTLWKKNAIRALKFASPVSLGISGKEMAELYQLDLDGKVNMLQFASLANNMEARTHNELDHLNIEQYNDLMIETHELTFLWNEKAGPIRKQVNSDIAEEMKAKVAEKEAESKKHIMKPVIAKA